jgi:hypothetical protein
MANSFLFELKAKKIYYLSFLRQIWIGSQAFIRRVGQIPLKLTFILL